MGEHTPTPYALEKGKDGTHTISNNEGQPVAFWLSHDDGLFLVRAANLYDGPADGMPRAAAAILRTNQALSPAFREQVAQMVEAFALLAKAKETT